jgi:uncharacterized membrane protein
MDADTALRRAKRPRTFLAGPYGHPFHAMAITIPIGSWVAAFVFDLVAIFGSRQEAFTRGAAWLVAIGTVGGVVAAVLGLLDYLTLTRGTKAHRTALTHALINVVVILLMLASWLVRLATGFDELSVGGFVLSLLGLLLLAVSGYLGGELAYRHGVRVADEETQLKAYR